MKIGSFSYILSAIQYCYLCRISAMWNSHGREKFRTAIFVSIFYTYTTFISFRNPAMPNNTFHIHNKLSFIASIVTILFFPSPLNCLWQSFGPFFQSYLKQSILPRSPEVPHLFSALKIFVISSSAGSLIYICPSFQATARHKIFTFMSSFSPKGQLLYHGVQWQTIRHNTNLHVYLPLAGIPSFPAQSISYWNQSSGFTTELKTFLKITWDMPKRRRKISLL